MVTASDRNLPGWRYTRHHHQQHRYQITTEAPGGLAPNATLSAIVTRRDTGPIGRHRVKSYVSCGLLVLSFRVVSCDFYRCMPLPRRQAPYSGNSCIYPPIMIESYFPRGCGLHRFVIKYHIFGFPSTFWAFWPKHFDFIRHIQDSSFL